MSGIVLSASVRQNLLSLQSTADLLATTQNRLSTGKKVNSALDNPTNYFTAQGLDNRASDISNLLDGIGNGVQVLQAANTGITSLQSLVDTAKSIANQALQTTVGYSTKSNVSTTIAGATSSRPARHHDLHQRHGEQQRAVHRHCRRRHRRSRVRPPCSAASPLRCAGDTSTGGATERLDSPARCSRTGSRVCDALAGDCRAGTATPSPSTARPSPSRRALRRPAAAGSRRIRRRRQHGHRRQRQLDHLSRHRPRPASVGDVLKAIDLASGVDKASTSRARVATTGVDERQQRRQRRG